MNGSCIHDWRILFDEKASIFALANFFLPSKKGGDGSERRRPRLYDIDLPRGEVLIRVLQSYTARSRYNSRACIRRCFLDFQRHRYS